MKIKIEPDVHIRNERRKISEMNINRTKNQILTSDKKNNWMWISITKLKRKEKSDVNIHKSQRTWGQCRL